MTSGNSDGCNFIFFSRVEFIFIKNLQPFLINISQEFSRQEALSQTNLEAKTLVYN